MQSKMKGQVGGMMQLLVGIIVLVAAVIPVAVSTINNQAFTGTLGSIMNVLPILLGVLGLAFVASYFSRK